MAGTIKASTFSAEKAASKLGFDALKAAKVVVATGAEENLSASMAYGDWDTGKTYSLVEPILRGKNVFFLNTDLGRNGLRTIRERLRELGKLELFDKHVRSWDVNSYPLVAAHLASDYMEQQLGDWLPDIDVWDGFTSFQGINADEYVLAMESKEMKDNALREAALASGMQDWGAIKRATMRPVAAWIAKTWGGKKVHKFMTCAEQTFDDEGVFGTVTKIRPYLQGQAAKLICAPFDLVYRTSRRKVDSKMVHCYTTRDESGKIFTKRRGMDLLDDGPADPKAVWDQLLAFS